MQIKVCINPIIMTKKFFFFSFACIILGISSISVYELVTGNISDTLSNANLLDSSIPLERSPESDNWKIVDKYEKITVSLYVRKYKEIVQYRVGMTDSDHLTISLEKEGIKVENYGKKFIGKRIKFSNNTNAHIITVGSISQRLQLSDTKGLNMDIEPFDQQINLDGLKQLIGL